MIPESQHLQELRALILKSQCEPLSESEIVQLNELIQSDGGAEEVAALIDQLCALSDSGALDSLPIAELLSEKFGNQAAGNSVSPESASMALASRTFDNTPSRQVSEGLSPVTWSPKLPWLLGIAASYLIVASLAWSLAKSSSSDRPVAEIPLKSSEQPESNSTQLVSSSPQLVSMTACVWRPNGEAVPTLGAPVQVGEVLDLVEGIAELRIGEGTFGEALVRIEGPARVLIRKNGLLELHRGSMTATSLGTGRGNVTVVTPMGEASMDGQSSIGIVADHFVDELHVFSGNALLKPASFALGNRNELLLEEGEAVHLTSNAEGSIRVMMSDASMSKFASARSSGFDPLNLGKDYERAVLESNPSIYWRFEELAGEFPYHVKNQGSFPGMDAAMIGEPGWRRYAENHVAELGKLGSSSGFRGTGLWPPKPLEEYTIEMWAKPELYHHGELICLHRSEQKADGRYSHTMMLETLAHHWRNPLENYEPNRLRFVHRSPASGEVSEGSNLIAEQMYLVRTWQHLAAQKKDGRVYLWVDGQLTAEQPDLKPLEENMQVVMGQLYISRSERRFVGQVDEVAIYDRCLSPQELRKHIKAAGRTVAPKKSDSPDSL